MHRQALMTMYHGSTICRACRVHTVLQDNSTFCVYPWSNINLQLVHQKTIRLACPVLRVPACAPPRLTCLTASKCYISRD